MRLGMLAENPGLTLRLKQPVGASLGPIALLVSSLSMASGATLTVTNVADSGAGSLRQAILDANANTGPDMIVFAIPGSGLHTIAPLTPLPPVTDPVVLDGTTQPGYAGQPLIELNGSNAGAQAGLRLLAGNSTVRGLVINRCGLDGLYISGAGNNLVQGNFIGTDSSGTVNRGNGQEGVQIYGSSGNVIGGTNAANRNIISGNAQAGLYIYNGSGNVVQGNYIGTTGAGTAALGNASHGVVLYNSTANQVGGATAGARNLIAGNADDGVYLYGSGSTGNSVQGNYIGTDTSGSLTLGNAGNGITLDGAVNNNIGGTNAGQGNVISGNQQIGIYFLGAGTAGNLVQGNYIGTTAAGTGALGNGYAGVTLYGAGSNLIGGFAASAGNVISGNKQDGLFLTNSFGSTIAGNLIGLNAAGSAALSNSYNGITLGGSSSNTLGGASAGARNVISGNSANGIQMLAGATANVVQGNYIGSDATGRSAVGNAYSGVRIESPGNTLGGSQAGAGNLLSGNAKNGVLLVGSAACSNVLQGNLIGVAAGGSAGLGNGFPGINLNGAPFNWIGGVGAGNVVSANNNVGIYLQGSGAIGNQLQGNKIGTDLSGNSALGNALDGIQANGAVSNIIGGVVAGAGNQISANANDGIYLTPSSGNLIQGNLIGTRADGLSDLGNSMSGIECDLGSSNNLIGGAPGAGNTIAFNRCYNYYGAGLGAGVRVPNYATPNINNRIICNSFFSNGGLGIDIGPVGVTANDAGDADTGANTLQNYPVLTQAVCGTSTGVRGTLNSTASRAFLLQFFANPACDSSGYGEGQIYLGDKTVTTGADGNASFVAALPTPVPPGYVITATATDSANNTSEFSACTPVAAAPILSVTPSVGQQLVISWANSPSGFVLKQTASLSPPVQWTTVTNAPALLNGGYTVSLPTPAGKQFYTLSFQ